MVGKGLYIYIYIFIRHEDRKKIYSFGWERAYISPPYSLGWERGYISPPYSLGWERVYIYIYIYIYLYSSWRQKKIYSLGWKGAI